jgi:hypothetical protein
MKIAVINLKTYNVCLQIGILGREDGLIDVRVDELMDGEMNGSMD